MAVTNSDIARMFNETADLLEIKGENPFKVRAYRNAARIVQNIAKPLKDLIEEGYELTKIPGIGHDLSEYIKEIVKTGKFSKLERLKSEIPPQLIDMLAIEGLGPKRIRTLYERLHITSMEDLRRAATAGKIEKLPGFGPVLVKKILKGIKLAKKAGERFRLDVAENYARDLVSYLRKIPGILTIEVAGSFRRKKETVGDLDILVTAENWEKVSDHFVKYEGIKETVSKGPTRSSVILDSGLQIDLRSVPKESYGAALHYFTGSKSHNIEIRKLALQKGLKINEYGVFKDEQKIAGATESEVYKAVGLDYIEPELRENRGEIEAVQKGDLPSLVEPDEIRGDLHIHTRYSDGANTIEEMAQAAIDRGYEYIAITDHSKRMSIAGGLDEKAVLKQIEHIQKLNQRYKGFKILKGIEVDILEDGSLDLSDEVLKELDLVVAAIHSKFSLSREKQTYRLLKAMDNPYFIIVAHPTGRLIAQRQPYDIDMQRVIEFAKERGVILEINAQPQRLDLNDIYIKMAKDAGVKMAISTDAHDLFSLEYMRYGLYQARRGWCERVDIVNTKSLSELEKFIKDIKR